MLNEKEEKEIEKEYERVNELDAKQRNYDGTHCCFCEKETTERILVLKNNEKFKTICKECRFKLGYFLKFMG